jgi:hypothetical protein
MNVTSLLFGFVVAEASGVERQRALELGLVAGVAELPPAPAALLTLAFARALPSVAAAAPVTTVLDPGPVTPLPPLAVAPPAAVPKPAPSPPPEPPSPSPPSPACPDPTPDRPVAYSANLRRSGLPTTQEGASPDDGSAPA